MSMNIKVLGTRGEIEESAPYHSHHSGVLIDDAILLDCGEQKNNIKIIVGYDGLEIIV